MRIDLETRDHQSNRSPSLAADFDNLIGAAQSKVAEYHHYVVSHVDSVEPLRKNFVATTSDDAAIGALAELVFETLTSREYCYLGRQRVTPYKASAIRNLKHSIRTGASIEFFYDLGGGYHASLEPGVQPLSFEVGLGELLVLRQIVSFATRVQAIYPPGVHFNIVIDNLCAFLVNDIPISNTESYTVRLRKLITQLGLSGLVDVLVESSIVRLSDIEAFDKPESIPEKPLPTPDLHRNVERFLGRTCSVEEACHRLMKYEFFSAVSERALAPFVDGVHLTQRASPSTLCFRAFPGSSSRIQAGQVVLAVDQHRRFLPMLLTSESYSRHEMTHVESRLDIDELISKFAIARTR